MILLELEKINLLFNDTRIIRDLYFKINEEEIMGLIGPTQAGKTTFFDLISGIYKPTSGKVIFEGQDITNLSIEKTNSIGISRTFQNGNIFNDLTVGDNVRVGFYNSLDYKLKDVIFRSQKFFDQEQDLTNRVEELLDIFDLGDYKDSVKLKEECSDLRLKVMKSDRKNLDRLKLVGYLFAGIGIIAIAFIICAVIGNIVSNGGN